MKKGLFLLIATFMLLAITLNTTIFAENDSIPSVQPDPLNNPNAEFATLVSATIITPSGATVAADKNTNTNTPPTFPTPGSYPSATPVSGTESYYYNCHCFAWYFCGNLNGITNSRGFWISSSGVNTYEGCSCYTKITAIPNTVKPSQLVQYQYRKYLQVGDIIVFCANNSNQHSAVVTSLSSSGVYVRSKWSSYEVFDHKVEDCPYTNVGGEGNLPVYCTVEVYRPSHNTSDNTMTPSYVGGNYVFPRYMDYSSNKHKQLCDCGRTRQLKTHTYVQTGSSTWQCSKCGHITNISPNSGGFDE